MAKGTKTGGRQKGTPNKVTEMVRQATEPLAEKTDQLIEQEWGRFLLKLHELEPKEYCTIMKDLIKHRIPAYQSISFDKETTEALSREQLLIVRMSQDAKIKELDT